MDKIRTRLFVAVSSRLASAADTEAKTDLVEELSDNLYQRYLDLTAGGMAPEEAYGQTLEDLGDVNELLAFLETSQAQPQQPPKKDSTKDFTEALAHNVEHIVRETMVQAREAVGQAKNIARDLAAKLKDRSPDGFEGGFNFHFDENGQEGQAGEGENGASGWNKSYSFGYDKNRGGFFAQCDDNQPPEERCFPAEAAASLDVSVVGDVTIWVDQEEQILVSASEKDMKKLAVAAENGVLTVKALPKDPSLPFLSQHSADVELHLPKKVWESIRIITASGDVLLHEGLEADAVTIQTTSGDLLSEGMAAQLQFQAVAGDMCLRSFYGSVEASTVSGDISAAGAPERLHLTSSNGDIKLHLAALPKTLEAGACSGNIKAYLPGDQGFTLRARAAAGEFSSEFPLTPGPDNSAVYLDGIAGELVLATTSGNISLRKA